ncbi:MAG TPA: family 10 glycosylhydrolase, partial [Clostridia bacterium]|nr:family 10 glycosylhydrolase [Clostridia bacterium]
MALLVQLPVLVPAQTPEFRGMWVNGWNTGLQNASQVSTLVNQVRAANCNAMVAQVRRRGDAFYNSHFEPHVTGTSPANFDALSDLINKAHNTSVGPYVEVHAWLVTYHIWRGATNASSPPQPNHPLRLHPDWLL